jgi:magnesium transporter
VWVDLVDPDDAALTTALDGTALHRTARDQLQAPIGPDDDLRPALRSDGGYAFGLLTSPVVRGAGEIVFLPIFVIVLPERVVTVRRSVEGSVAEMGVGFGDAVRSVGEPGMVLWHLVDDLAERYLGAVDQLDDLVDEMEERIETDPALEVRRDIASLRRCMLLLRRNLGPFRDATRAVLDDRIEIDGHSVFPRDVDIHFGEAYDKLLRATDGLDLARELLSGVRDYHQAQIATLQNDVMKRLTVIASLLLLPTFIVGLYGQNLHGSPEMSWSWGYAFSWGVIVLTTLVQLVLYRRKRWI